MQPVLSNRLDLNLNAKIKFDNFRNSFYRNCDWNRLGDMVFDSAQEKTVCMENITVSSVSGDFIAVGDQRFSTIVLGRGRACIMAFINYTANDTFV